MYIIRFKMAFWNKKQPKEVNLTLEQQIKKIESRVLLLESETLDLATAHNILRNKVLKKIQFKNPKDDEKDSDSPENLYSKVLLKE
jgi:hypothetical protein